MLQQQQAQLAKDNAEYDIDAALSLYPETERPFIKQALTMAGKIRPDGMVIGKDMREVPQLFEKYPKVAIGRGMMEFETLAKENEKLAKKGDEQSQQQMMANAQRMTEIKKNVAALSGKEDEADKDFTLGQGQTRFSASGDEIASVEPKPEKVWGEPTKMVIDGKTVMVQTSNTGEMKTVAQGASPAVQINFDKDVIKQQIKDLPKLKEKAKTSKSGIARIDKMLGLIEKGAGGRLGQIKAWLAPTLEVAGIKSQGLADAQLYQILARTLGGSMRMEIIGPGQVSDYENRLMAAINGGGGTATEAAKELLQYYRGIADGNINDYNTAAGAIGDVSPASKRANPPIGAAPPPEKKRYKFNPATGQLE